MKARLAILMLAGACLGLSAQASMEKVRAAEAYIAHGELAARLAANDMLAVFDSFKDYFGKIAPNDGARLKAEAAFDFAYARDPKAAKAILADPLFANPAVGEVPRYLRAILAWALDGGSEPVRKSGDEVSFGRALLLKAAVLGDAAALSRLNEVAAAVPRGKVATPTERAIVALASGKAGVKDLMGISDPAPWPIVTIPLASGGTTKIYLFDPAALYARARLMLAESGAPGAAWSPADSARAFLLGDYAAVPQAKSADSDYRPLLWRLLADRRLGRDVSASLSAFESTFGADPQRLATGALYLAKYSDLGETAARWYRKAVAKGGSSPLYSQIGSLVLMRNALYSDSFNSFQDFMSLILDQPKPDSAEWISYYCMSLFENGHHDSMKGKQIIVLLSALERMEGGDLVWVAIKCASQYYSDVINPMEYHNAN